MADHFLRFPLFLAATAFFAASPADAGKCGYDYCWGAITIGPDYATGRVIGKRTTKDAADAAIERCGEACSYPEVFQNSCGALAASREGRVSFGGGETQTIAIKAAKEQCEVFGETCRLRVWACSF